MAQVTSKAEVSQQESAAIPPRIRIFRRGQTTEIIPAVDNLMEEYGTIRHRGHSSQSTGFQVRPQWDPLVLPRMEQIGWPPREYMQTYAGLEDDIVEFLSDAGYEVELTGRRPGKLSEPDWSALGGRPGDSRLLRLVQQHERGLIRYREDSVRLSWLIAQIALVWPRERIVVVTTRNHDAEYLARGLRHYIADVSLATTRRHPGRVRVTVATYCQLRQAGVDARRRTILIAVNPTELLNDTPMLYAGEWLPHLSCRLYGLMPDNLTVAPGMEDLLQALYGPRCLYIPRHGFHDLPVDVVALPFHDSRKRRHDIGSEGTDAHTIKRQQVWHNALRNRWLAGLARALAEDNDQALVCKYKAVAGPLLSRLGQRVGVLVENVEHAGQLLKRLRGWPIVTSAVTLQHSLPVDVRQAIEAGQNRSACQTADVIVTPAAIRFAGRLDVLIRADGGSGLPPFPPKYFDARDGCGDRLVLVDVDDRHHPHLRQRSQGRRAAYMDRGWSVDGEPQSGSPDERRLPPASGPDMTFRVSYISARGKSRHGSALAAYQERYRRRQRKKQQGQLHVTLQQIAKPEFLYACCRHLQQHGGQAPGQDGISYSELSPTEWGDVVQSLSRAILKSRYRPQQTRKQPIPKPGSDEKRILSIGSTCDRIVGLALQQMLEPHLDRLFLDGSWGFRRQRSTWRMLAKLKRQVEATGRWVLAIDDVRQAFDNVPIDGLLDALQKAQQELKTLDDPVAVNDSVLKLVAVVAKGTAQTRNIGLDQGHNISPMSLNVLLHYVHDVPLTAALSFPCWYRYADNLVYPCRDVAEGRKVLRRAGELLHQSGLSLKGNDGVTDLRKHPAFVLGFMLREQNGHLHLSVGKLAWQTLAEHLSDAHRALNPLQVADMVITGWINALGPAFADGEPVVSRICSLAVRFGFREISRERINRQVMRAWRRWDRIISH